MASSLSAVAPLTISPRPSLGPLFLLLRDAKAMMFPSVCSRDGALLWAQDNCPVIPIVVMIKPDGLSKGGGAFGFEGTVLK